jgi:hypothetical protein
MWTAMVSDVGTGAADSHGNAAINASHIMQQRDVGHRPLVSCANTNGVLAKSDGVRAYYRSLPARPIAALIARIAVAIASGRALFVFSERGW